MPCDTVPRLLSPRSQPATLGAMQHNVEHLQEPVLAVARRDFTTLHRELTVQQALDAIRQRGVGEKIVYFYVVDAEDRLVGVVPTRRLLTAPLGSPLAEIMVPKVMTIPATATVLEACEMFILHKFLAFPVVDTAGQLVGVVDVSTFTGEVLDLAERAQTEGLFESIGFRVSQVRDASPWKAFRFRFPWLLATIASGLLCAALASAYELTLAKAVVLSFFLTLVLALGESVSIQSMTVTIQSLRAAEPSLHWYVATLRRELATALLLGSGCALLVGLVVWGWRGALLPAVVISGSIFVSLGSACALGLSIPTLLHAWKLDPKIAAGPVTLALTDLCTLFCYFTFATWWL
jgi:magnesium transporter